MSTNYWLYRSEEIDIILLSKKEKFDIKHDTSLEI